MMDIRGTIHEWLLQQPLWQQELARRLAAKTHFSSSEIDEVLELVLHARAGRDVQLSPLRLDELPNASDARPFRVLSIGSLSGVGVVADDQTIELEPDGLTVVYGANGAGKSTYVRVMKRLFRAVDTDDELRSDVFATADPDPSPTVRLRVRRDARDETLDIDLDSVDDLDLDAVSVFDSNCAELYLDRKNTVAYVPLEVRLLSRMAATQDEMRSRLADRRDEELESRPRFRSIPSDTEAASRLETLTHLTDLDELRQFCHLDDSTRRRLDDVRAALAAAKTADARADADAARRDADETSQLIDRVNHLHDVLSDDHLSVVTDAALHRDRTRRAADAAAAAFGALSPKPGGEAWKEMWESSRAFTEQHGEHFPPREGDECPLCLRPTDESTADLFAQFEQYVHSTLQQDAASAEDDLDSMLARLDRSLVQSARALSQSCLPDDDRLVHAVSTFLDRVDEKMAVVHEQPSLSHGSLNAMAPNDMLLAWETQRRQHAETIEQSLDSDGRRTLERELRELEGIFALGQAFDAVKSWVETLQHVEQIDRARQALATNRLTSKQRELSDVLVTEMLAKKLAEEISTLRCEHVQVDVAPHTAVGKTRVELNLAGAYGTPKVGDILSEGEQRAVALAFFLAEIGNADHGGGMVLDDPVSSLDDQRKSHIANRIVEEAPRRQVIVFTHDLPFMLELLGKAEAEDVPIIARGIWRSGSSVGRIDDEPPFSALKLKRRIARLTEIVEQWDKQPAPRNEDEAWRRVCDVYNLMRVAWEKAVEERLFRGVVQRFQREVKTQSLKDVSITKERVEMVNDGMSRCSTFVHDAPPGTRTVLPSRGDLESDLALLRDFEKETRH